jgi:biotin carboxyl carrier protein
MENEIVAPHDGVVAGVAVRPGDPVAAGQIVCRVEPPQASDDHE